MPSDQIKDIFRGESHEHNSCRYLHDLTVSLVAYPSFFAEQFYCFQDFSKNIFVRNYSYVARRRPEFDSRTRRKIVFFVLRFYPLPNDDIVGSLGSILGTGIIFVLDDERGGGGRAVPVLSVNKPEMTDARAAHGRVT
jgi:hypothetical protein